MNKKVKKKIIFTLYLYIFYVYLCIFFLFMLFKVLYFCKGDDGDIGSPFKKIFDKSNRITLNNVFSEQFRPQKNDLFWFDYGNNLLLLNNLPKNDYFYYYEKKKKYKVFINNQLLNICFSQIIGDDGTIVQVSQRGNIELYNVVSKSSTPIASIMDLRKVIIDIL